MFIILNPITACAALMKIKKGGEKRKISVLVVEVEPLV